MDIFALGDNRLGLDLLSWKEVWHAGLAMRHVNLECCVSRVSVEQYLDLLLDHLLIHRRLPLLSFRSRVQRRGQTRGELVILVVSPSCLRLFFTRGLLAATPEQPGFQICDPGLLTRRSCRPSQALL